MSCVCASAQLNLEQTAFCRVNYPPALWDQLDRALQRADVRLSVGSVGSSGCGF
jgi:hypothetical protein